MNRKNIMRKRAPKVGETRIIKKFILFPKTLPVEGTDGGEIRSLCLARIKQVRIDCYLSHEWKDICFV